MLGGPKTFASGKRDVLVGDVVLEIDEDLPREPWTRQSGWGRAFRIDFGRSTGSQHKPQISSNSSRLAPSPEHPR